MELKIIEPPKVINNNPNKKIKFVDGQVYEYEIYKLSDKYSDSLRQKLNLFDFNNPPIPPRYLAVSLIETMALHNGVGLSANQCGLPYRVFVMGAQKVGFACFNPEIIEATGEETFEEGCLSWPGMFIPVKRAASIKVRYQDMNGKFQEESFSGLTARIFLHEYDHMEGIFYTSKVSPIILERQKKKVKGNLKKLGEQRRATEKARKEAAEKKS